MPIVESPTPTIRIECTFCAPIERVFRAWCEPEELRKWIWGNTDQEVQATADVRKGGSYRVSTTRPDVDDWVCSGSYLEVTPNRKLVYTMRWDAPMGYEAPDETVTIEFASQGDQTKITCTHEGVPDVRSCQGHEAGWNDMFDALSKALT